MVRRQHPRQREQIHRTAQASPHALEDCVETWALSPRCSDYLDHGSRVVSKCTAGDCERCCINYSFPHTQDVISTLLYAKLSANDTTRSAAGIFIILIISVPILLMKSPTDLDTKIGGVCDENQKQRSYNCDVLHSSKKYPQKDIPFIFNIPPITEFIRWGIKFK